MKRLTILTALLAALAILLAITLVPNSDLNLTVKAFIGLGLFLIINVIAESQPLRLPGSQAHAEITISGLTSYALLALFSPFYAAVVGATAVFIVEVVLRKKAFVKCVFNASQTFISLACAALVYHFLLSNPAFLQPIPIDITALTLAISTYFLLNTGLVSLGLSQLIAASFWRTWLGNYRWELIYVPASIPLALLLILAYERLWIAGPLLFIAPLFLLRESYAQYVRLKTTYTETVRTLIKVIETHDTYTAGHSLRVAEYAKRLALARKLSVKEVEKIEIAAYLHDLGKVDLAITHLVRKPGRLTSDEKRRVQLHPLVSADLAAQVTYFKGDIERVIRHHHEHYNGTGYPHGLRGEEIPIGSRIILIADAFDAMTSNRMYRSALDLQRVRSEFIKYSGIQFDPMLVSLFLAMCVKDESMVIQQIEIPYEELLSTKLQETSVEAIESVG
jgi:HD-GYP domain-containing protein (c-di-GMP phosphodiesterase class II)